MRELRQYEHIYFLGIGGIGMSALVRCCLLGPKRLVQATTALASVPFAFGSAASPFLGFGIWIWTPVARAWAESKI